MKIGWTNLSYNIERAILNKTSNVDYIRSRSFGAVVSRFCGRFGLQSPVNENSVYVGGTADRHVDLFHFFNLLGCGLCRKPYVTTFETSVPRGLKPGSSWFNRGLESIMSNRCRKLLALSECTKRVQLDALKQFLTESDLNALENKIMVLHPPQRILCDDLEIKAVDGKLKAIFVGRDFFRKGGGEVLRAFVRIRREFPVELWMIGDPGRLGYSCDPAIDDSALCLRMIEDNKEWVHWTPSLPNDKTLELMRTCDVGLLPTRADTYGYSVLEMQACGLPVITTDVRALPEINDDDCGWVIRGCGKRDGSGVFGEADYSTPEKLLELSQTIERGVYAKVVEAITNRESVVRKGKSSWKRIVAEHDLQKYGDRIFNVYQEALARS